MSINLTKEHQFQPLFSKQLEKILWKGVASKYTFAPSTPDELGELGVDQKVMEFGKKVNDTLTCPLRAVHSDLNAWGWGQKLLRMVSPKCFAYALVDGCFDNGYVDVDGL